MYLFYFLVQIRLWLNPSVIEQKISSMRSQAIHYMCQLSDTDLRLVGTKNTTELMYESFKELSGHSSVLDELVSPTNSRGAGFRLDKDGLSLALKYFLCSTLTIRLSGIAQMNVNNSFSRFLTLNTRFEIKDF